MTTSVVTEKQLFGYTVVEVLHDGNHSRIYRCKKGEKFYILKTHPAAYCTDVTAKKFKREFVVGYQLSKESSRIVKYLSFEEEVVMRDMEKNYSVAVVQEDYGGLSLLSLIPNGGFSLPQFFNIAVQCAHGLRDIHRLDTIHRDIKPANLVMNPESGEVRFIDFGNSSRLREVTESASTSPHRLCGTMSYLSPEQTGRMNRSIDYRTDFYSLGITFYQLLTNELPFTSSDVMELIHCHIAVEPPALPNSIPQVLQQIVFKLLKKDAQERYQSCRGLMYDLQKCQSTMVQTYVLLPVLTI
jgi:serine/threonine protein kinase